MLVEIVELLRCPWCAGEMRIVAGTPRSGRIDDGELACRACGRVTEISDGIWDAMGPHRAERTAAQFSNVIPPTPQLYERLWRVRSLSLMADRSFPISEELAELVAALRPGPGRVMVDVACSEGLYARALAAAGSTVIALDHSRPFLKRVVERARHDDLPIAAVRGLAQHLPVGDGAVVGVGIGGSLNEIGDKADAVAEAARVLSPDGRLFSMSLVAARTSRGRAVQRLAGAAGIDFPSETVTVDLAERAGLTPIDQRRDGVVLRLTAERPAAEG